MTMTPFNQQSKSEYVESQLEKLVLSDKYNEGDKLPTQNELSEQFQVGTRIIREALKQLEAKGLVSMEQGRGVFVRKQKLDFYLKSLTNSISHELPQNKKVLIDLTKAREIWEINAIEKFIEDPDYRILDELKSLVDKMTACRINNDMQEYKRLDIEFHHTLVKMINNEIINYMYGHLTNLLMYSIDSTEKKNDYSGLSDHQDIIKYLNTCNRDGAIEAIKNHLQRTIKSIQSLETF